MQYPSFKLHLRPSAQELETNGLKIGDLHPSKSAVEIFADFLSYMYHCAVKFIQEHHVEGPELWAKIKHKAEFVLSHPNGWQGRQQQQMRRAAIQAGLVPNDVAGFARVRFVSEGEASLLACLSSTLGPTNLQVCPLYLFFE